MDSFFQRLNRAMNPTKAESERRRAFREQVQRNIDRTRELATQMKLEREARERGEQQPS
jgi:hypothetical protein